jgi:hypothetical protein
MITQANGPFCHDFRRVSSYSWVPSEMPFKLKVVDLWFYTEMTLERSVSEEVYYTEDLGRIIETYRKLHQSELYQDATKPRNYHAAIRQESGCGRRSTPLAPRLANVRSPTTSAATNEQ